MSQKNDAVEIITPFIQLITAHDTHGVHSKHTSTEHGKYIDDLARVLQPWGMPIGVARLYGYLLLQDKPVSLDEMCEQLQIAKSTASVSARELERSNLVKRHTVRGTKRVLYSVSEGNTALMQDKVAMAKLSVSREPS